MEHIYDLVIIGGGPAGYTAALYAARAGLDAVLIEKMSAGGQMALTGDIENYPGFDEGVDGFTLGMKMQKGAEKYGGVTEYGEVIGVDFSGDVKKVETTKKTFFSKTVILAVGASPRKLGISGEIEFAQRGVHYCAHCDGRFYKDKTVVCIGGGNSAVTDALYLSRLAKKVYLVHRRDALRASKIYQESLFNAENVEIIWNSTATEISDNDGEKVITIKNTQTDEETKLSCDGVFVSIGRKPETDFLSDAVSIDKDGYIVADETTKTNVEGIFAAGDVRTKELRQIVTAVSDGAVAVHCVEKYLS